MLNPGKDWGSMFKYNTLAPIVAKNQSWEITMGDLTNTSVFVQFWRGWQTNANGTSYFWPRGIKYWTPRYLYSAMLPTQAYWYGQWIDVTTQDWEIRVAKTVKAGVTLPGWEKITAWAIDNNTANKTLLYAGSAGTGCKIYVSDDQWDTWNTLIDINAELWTNHVWIRQLLLIKDKKCKKLVIIAGQIGTGQSAHLYTYSLSDFYGFDLCKHESGKFYDSNTNEESRYPETPSHIHLTTIPQSTITYSAVADSLTVKSFIQVHDISWANMLMVDGLSVDDIAALRQSDSVGIWPRTGTPSISKCNILFLNDTMAPLEYKVSEDKVISVPWQAMVIQYFSVDYTKSYQLYLYNKITVSSATDCRPGMILSAGIDLYKIYKISSTTLYINHHISNSDLTYTGWTFTFTTDSYKTVFDVTWITGKSILWVKYKKGSTIFSVVDEFSSNSNERTLFYKDYHMYSAPQKFTAAPTVIVADKDIWASSAQADLEHLQICGVAPGSATDLHNVVQIMKLGYDETISDPDEYIGAILYYPTEKYQYQFITLQLFTIKDQRLRKSQTSNIRDYQTYYSTYTWASVDVDHSYANNKKYTTQWFDEDIPTTMAAIYDSAQWPIPISIGYDEISNSSYFSTFKRIGWDTIAIWKANKDWVTKEIDIPGPWYATGVEYANNKVFFCSKNYGRIYTYMTQTSYGNTVTQTKYEVISMQKYNSTKKIMEEQDYSNLLNGTIYEWSYVCVSDIDWTIYAYDSINEIYPFSEKWCIEDMATNQSGVSVNVIIPLGDRLLMQADNSKIRTLDQANDIRNKAFLVSSIYGAYLWSVKKNWIQAKIIINNQAIVWSKWQKFRLAVSFDNGVSFNYLSKVIGKPFLADDFYNTTTFNANYEYSWADLIWTDKNEMRFRYPYESISKRMCYKIEIYPWTCKYSDEIIVSHIENQYLLQSFKELLLQLDIYLRPKAQLLDKSFEHEPDAHRKKIDFLQTVWDEQRKCEVSMPRWAKYYWIPFAVPGTGNDWFSISSIDIEPGKKDMDRATYSVQMSFKTIIKL
jgi:hypothetical protein